MADTLSAFGAGGHPAGLCATHYDARILVETFVQWAREPQPGVYRELPMLAGAQAALRARWPCR